MIKRCIGCGAILQNTDKNKSGYSPKENQKYCMRCFRLTNYSDYTKETVNKDNKQIIAAVNKNAKYVYFLIDFLNINSETIETFKKITCPKTLIISKRDIMPKTITDARLKSWLSSTYNLSCNIFSISSKSTFQISKILKNLKESNETVAYILGYTNAGKSTLINKLKNNNDITTSLMPNTTIDFINIKIDDLVLTDAPGFTLDKTIYDPDDIEMIKKLNSKETPNIRNYQTKEEQSFIIENKIRLSNLKENSISFYMNDEITIKKVYKKDDLINEKFITLSIPNNSDIIIKSLGFINIKNACELTIYSNYLDLIEVRPSIFGVHYE